MAVAYQAFSEGTSSKWAYRLAIPIGVLCLYAIMAGLWLLGAHSLYFGALRLLGVEPFSFPFLDTHAVLSAAECGRQGIEVYLSNPCDVLGRPHAYSPPWLAILPGSLGTSAPGWGVGFTVVLLGLGFYPERKSGLRSRPRRILVFHRRLLRPEPTVRVCGSPGRRRLPHPDRGVADGCAVRVGSCANASHGSAARARATRLGRERDAVPRYRRLVGHGLLLCRPEHRLSPHSSSPRAVRACLPPSIDQRPRGTMLLRADERVGYACDVGEGPP